MVFLPAELAKEARNEVLSLTMNGGPLVLVRISVFMLGHVIQFFVLALPPPLCQSDKFNLGVIGWA